MGYFEWLARNFSPPGIRGGQSQALLQAFGQPGRRLRRRPKLPDAATIPNEL